MTRSPNLFLMLGFPGSGKSTASGYINLLTGANVLSVDTVRTDLGNEVDFSPEGYDRLYYIADNVAALLLRQGQNVIYDANLSLAGHREEKYDMCRQIGATPWLIHVTTPQETALRNALDRECDHLYPPGETAASLFERVANKFESPRRNEPVISIGYPFTIGDVRFALESSGVTLPQVVDPQSRYALQ